MWSIYVMFFLASDSKPKIRGAFHRKKQYRYRKKKNVFSWLQKKTLFSPIQPTHRGWHNRTNTRCPNRGYTTSMHWSLTQFTPASMEITVPDPSQRKEPKLYRCLGETGRVLFEGGRVVSGGWTILVSSVCVFFAFGWLMRWWCDGLSKCVYRLLLSSSPNILSTRSFEF